MSLPAPSSQLVPSHSLHRRPKAAKGFLRLPRLPEVPGRSHGPREAQGGLGSEREQEGVRQGEGSKESKASEPAKGLQRLPKLAEAPGRSQGPGRPREALGVRGSKRRQGGEGSKGSKAPVSD